MNDIERISGASAGAIMASLFALEPDPGELENVVNRINMLDALDIVRDEISLEGFSSPKNFIKITQETLEYLFERRLDEAFRMAECHPVLKERIVALREKVIHSKISFEDVEELRSIFIGLGKPNEIKSLYIVVTNLKTGELIGCCSDTTPKLSIAEAVAASGAFPRGFRPLLLNINGEDILCTDGGVTQNTPFDQRNPDFLTREELIASRMMVFLGTEREGNNLLYGTFSKTPEYVRVLKDAFCYGLPVSRNDQINDRRLYEEGVNVINIDRPQALTTGTLNVSLELKESASQNAKKSVERFLDNRVKWNNSSGETEAQEEAMIVQGGDLLHCLLKFPLSNFEDTIEYLKKQGIRFNESILQSVRLFRCNEIEYGNAFMDQLAAYEKGKASQKMVSKALDTYLNLKLPENEENITWKDMHRNVRIERLLIDIGRNAKIRAFLKSLSEETINQNKNLKSVHDYIAQEERRENVFKLLMDLHASCSETKLALVNKAIGEVYSFSHEDLGSDKFILYLLKFVQAYSSDNKAFFWKSTSKEVLEKIGGTVHALLKERLAFAKESLGAEDFNEVLLGLENLIFSNARNDIKHEIISQILSLAQIMQNPESSSDTKEIALVQFIRLLNSKKNIVKMDDSLRKNVLEKLISLFEKIKNFFLSKTQEIEERVDPGIIISSKIGKVPC